MAQMVLTAKPAHPDLPDLPDLPVVERWQYSL
jgi:hypothetical protein